VLPDTQRMAPSYLGYTLVACVLASVKTWGPELQDQPLLTLHRTGENRMSEASFADGMIIKARNPNAPDYVIAKVSIKVDEFKETLDANNKNGWVNIEMLISKGGKPYAKIDTWEPSSQQQPQQQPAPPPPFPEAYPQNPQPAQPVPQQPASQPDEFDVSDESIDDIPF
jgi:hypothetical protein